MSNSSRFPDTFAANALTLAVQRARAGGRKLIDLTLTNPTRAGFEYPPDLLSALTSAEALRYDPQPLGMAAARRAVAESYRSCGVAVDPGRVLLTASTSEAYTWLLKLLCRPSGESVLIPTPSYPLFDHLTRLDGVHAQPYRLEYHGRWSIDFDSLDRGWSDTVRAVVAVSPNNPTGSVLDPAELTTLGERCTYLGGALIVDEVFADYPLGQSQPEAATMPADCLTFRLGGLSKSVGLPQVKLGWIIVSGPDALTSVALQRLELIADTYLSVSTPVQVAASALLDRGAVVRAQILDRVRRNHSAIRAAAARYPSLEVLHADAGWSVVLRVPATRSEEALALVLLEEDDVLVHPGFFFDFAHEAFLVISLLPPPQVFDEGIRRLMERAHA